MENAFLQEVIAKLQEKYPSAQVVNDQFGMTNVIIDKGDLLSFVEVLKNEMGFDFLTDICGAHYPYVKGSEFQVVYHLHNLVKNTRVRIKINLSADKLSVPTLVNLYSGANWMERETFDFYGIDFEGHPDLRRILNMDDMDYHPMRKEYALEDETRDDKNDSFFGR